MNIAPPVFSLPLFLVELSVKLEFDISTLLPVMESVPPLEVLGFEGSPVLVPILRTKELPSRIPLCPCQYIAPPSSPATLSVKLDASILQLSPEMYNAAPSSIASLLIAVRL